MEHEFVELAAGLRSSAPIRNIYVDLKVDHDAINTFRDQHGNRDVYESVFRYDRQDIRSAIQDGPLSFDLDGEFALKDTQILMRFLIERGCPHDSIWLYFSGNKGFHVEVPLCTLDIQPAKDLNIVFGVIAKEIKSFLHLPSLDTGIYDSVRLWRIINSQHPVSDLYKIPLLIEDLNKSLEEIKSVARSPNYMFPILVPGPWAEFAPLYEKARKMMKITNSRHQPIFEPVNEGERNTITFKRALRLKSEGKSLEEAIEACCHIKDHPPLPVDEIKRTVISAYQEKYTVNLDKSQRKTEEKREITSFTISDDGLICEELYDKQSGSVSFAIYDGQQVDVAASVVVNGKHIHPVEGALITEQIVKLPSTSQDYGSDTDLFDQIRAFIHTYVDITPAWESWSAYYVMLSWVYDKLPVCPYLCALGPSDSGKTRFIQTVGSICYKPFFASGSVTASPIFRTLDQFHGTLIINEFDHIGTYKDEIIVLLNNGYEKGFPVSRTEGDAEKVVKYYQVYGPKLFSARQRKNDWAFESRLLTIPMKPTRRSDIPVFLLDDFDNRALELRNKLLSFRFRHYREPVQFRNDLFPGIKGRLKQTLLSVTSVVRDEAFLAQVMVFAKEMENSLKSIRGFDLDAAIFHELVKLWENGEHEPQIKTITATIKEITGRDKLSPKGVGAVVRDELGFETKRGGAEGNYVVILNQYQISSLKSRYEIDESSGSSASSDSAVVPTEQTEHSEVSSVLPDNREAQLIREELEAWEDLQGATADSEEYEIKRKRWVRLRYEGVEAGIFKFFTRPAERGGENHEHE